jgi:dihydrofolate reductase
MRKLSVFNHVTIDGFICDLENDMSFAHENSDAQWESFSEQNVAGAHPTMLMGRVTYDMMKSFWPTEEARKSSPAIAEAMNSSEKIVFSRTQKSSDWANTRFVNDDIVGAVKKLKKEKGPDMIIFGSGSIVSQLSAAKLIDEYQIIVNPYVLGKGKTMFATVEDQLKFRRTSIQTFQNGNVILTYVV